MPFAYSHFLANLSIKRGGPLSSYYTAETVQNSNGAGAHVVLSPELQPETSFEKARRDLINRLTAPDVFATTLGSLSGVRLEDCRCFKPHMQTSARLGNIHGSVFHLDSVTHIRLINGCVV